ncbi:hypothetical protein C2G38_2166587 [Gigaspora rosea]|uniref:Uncharacterized protein n=1 Tax=Gigaspora rosea TaxID=44941 RepID=A0A397VVY7_9GLOM|nr:hypothetical protein C2G38_2166587 [Gigaspora rosea]
MDGSSIFGSDLEKKFGWNSVPDARGLFLRCKNNGRNDGLENPSGELDLGQYQSDNLKSQNLVNLFVNNIEGQWGQSAYSGELVSHRIATQPVDSTRSFYTGYSGEQETCPKSITLEMIFKILIAISGITKLEPVRSMMERILITYLWNKLGKAGSRYSRLTHIRKISKSELPDENDIFNSVMKRIEFNGHPSGISANSFYLTILIAHDLFNTSHKDLIININ